MHCFSFLIWGDPNGDFGMRVAHQQTEARNDPSVVGKAEIRGQFLIAQPPSHDAQNRLNSGILRHNLDFFREKNVLCFDCVAVHPWEWRRTPPHYLHTGVPLKQMI
jgi:hypothetical protein